MIRVGVLNYADVRNFGDVLFPLLVAQEVTKRIPYADVTYITPTGASWGGMTSVKYDDIGLDSFDALLLGGGEVVHRFDEMLKGIYSNFGLKSIARPTDIVFTWTQVNVPFKAWLGLGVPPLSPEVSLDIASSAISLNLFVVRGSNSYKRVLDCGVESRSIRKSPDLGWLFPRLLSGHHLPSHPADGQPYMVVQALGFADPVSVARDLQLIAERSGLRVVLLPLTRCWNDIQPLRLLHDLGGGAFILIDDAMEDIDKLAVLGQATFTIGQSMHGFIGASSQNRPAGLVTPFRDDKFEELLSDLELECLRCPSWDGLIGLSETLLRFPPISLTGLRKKKAAELDALFDDVCEGILASLREWV